MTDFSHHTPKALTEADLAGLPRAVSTHTPGRISVRLPFSTASRYPAYIESGDRILAAINGGVTYEDLLQAHANARRLVACWNALEGVPTNDIESVLIHGKALKDVVSERDALAGRVAELEAERDTPHLHNFSEAVTLEALHQRERWGSEHDAGKKPADWFWLVGYLAGKALHAQAAGNTDKALHHTISTAAALANWHAAITGDHTAMRPGIDDAALTPTPESKP